MPREYDEKRDFIRVSIDCPIHFWLEGQQQQEVGKVKNLSGRGLMFVTELELSLESRVEVRINPENDLTPPLHAHVRVVRVARPRRGEGFEIGAVIQEMFDD